MEENDLVLSLREVIYGVLGEIVVTENINRNYTSRIIIQLIGQPNGITSVKPICIRPIHEYLMHSM